MIGLPVTNLQTSKVNCYPNPTVVRVAVNRKIMTAKDISRITESLNNTNARFSPRNWAGTKTAYSVQRVQVVLEILRA